MDLYKVLVVDDEKPALENLRDLIDWQQNGCEIIAEAENGRRGYQQYLLYHPDIVITDIRMPISNGIELAKKIIEHNKIVKIILLSAYQDFSYAKSGLDLGAFGYVLKHDINENSLINILDKAKNMINQELMANRFFCEQYVKNILDINYKPLTDEVESETTKMFKCGIGIMFLQLDLPYFFSDTSDAREAVYKQNQFDIYEFIGDRSAENVVNISITNEKSIILYCLKQGKSTKLLMENAYQLAKQIQEKYFNQTNQTLSIAIGFCQDMSNLKSVYSNLCIIMSRRIFESKGSILFNENIVKIDSHDETSLMKLLESIKLGINTRNGMLIEKSITEMFDQYIVPSKDNNLLKRWSNELSFLLESVLNYNQPTMNIDHHIISKKLYSCYCVDEIKDYFIYAFNYVLLPADMNQIKSYSKKIEHVINCIYSNYNKDISLEKMAQDLEISYVYLCKLFKKETGKTFIEYLNHFRIEVAKEMLKSGHYKVYEVSDKVGFKTSQYFSFMFHKITGLSPMKYSEKSNYCDE